MCADDTERYRPALSVQKSGLDRFEGGWQGLRSNLQASFSPRHAISASSNTRSQVADGAKRLAILYVDPQSDGENYDAWSNASRKFS